MKHRVVSNSRELSCKLLIYCMELGKSVLKLWRELSMSRSSISMAIPRRMDVNVWLWMNGNATLYDWSLKCMSAFISLLWTLWSVNSIKTTMWMLCMLCWGGLLVLAWGRCGR